MQMIPKTMSHIADLAKSSNKMFSVVSVQFSENMLRVEAGDLCRRLRIDCPIDYLGESVSGMVDAKQWSKVVKFCKGSIHDVTAKGIVFSTLEDSEIILPFLEVRGAPDLEVYISRWSPTISGHFDSKLVAELTNAIAKCVPKCRKYTFESRYAETDVGLLVVTNTNYPRVLGVVCSVS